MGDSQAKPIFGLPPTADIFITKWIEKFEVVYDATLDVDVKEGWDKRTPTEFKRLKADLLLLEAVLAFQADAKRFNFTSQNTAAALAAHPEHGCCFEFVDYQLPAIEHKCKSVEKCKMGKQLLHGLVWQAFPLKLRRWANELLAIRAEAMKAGEWRIKESSQKRFEEYMGRE